MTQDRTASPIGGRAISNNTLWNVGGAGAPLVVAVFSIPLIIAGLGTDRFGLLALAWTILFGIACNASDVYGWGGVAWYSILIDYGVVGFVWLFFLYFIPLFWQWRAGRLDMCLVLFCALYLMSFYQRPVIWLPAQMLIYFAGIYWLAMTRVQATADAISR